MRLNVAPPPCFALCSSSVRRMSDRSTAPPGTSIDCKALMNALLRRLMSSSFVAPTTGGEGRLGLRKEIFGVLGGGRGSDREGSVPTEGATGRVAFLRQERQGGSAVVSAGTEQWLAWSRGCGDSIIGQDYRSAS